MPNFRPRFLEFFAGAGLVRQALQPEWRCVWANDISPKKARVYQYNFGQAELHVWAGGFHGFDALYPQAHISATARRTRTDWLTRVLPAHPAA